MAPKKKFQPKLMAAPGAGPGRMGWVPETLAKTPTTQDHGGVVNHVGLLNFTCSGFSLL